MKAHGRARLEIGVFFFLECITTVRFFGNPVSISKGGRGRRAIGDRYVTVMELITLSEVESLRLSIHRSVETPVWHSSMSARGLGPTASGTLCRRWSGVQCVWSNLSGGPFTPPPRPSARSRDWVSFHTLHSRLRDICSMHSDRRGGNS